MTRRVANRAWLVVGAVLALELVGAARVGFWPLSSGGSVAIRSTEHATARGKFGVTTGTSVGRGMARGAESIRFFVVEGPVAPGGENYRGGDRVIFDAINRGQMWLPVTRGHLVQVSPGPRQGYFVHDAQVETAPLPADFQRKDLEGFLNSTAAFEGAAGFQRWVGAKAR